MDIWQSIIIGIVEGITEFLPISSTGHLILTTHLLNIPQTEFVKSFEIIIQLGAILAVVVLYAPMLLKNRQIWKTILISFIPTAIIGATLYRAIKDILIGNLMITLISLLIGGFILIYLEKFHLNKPTSTRDTISSIENLSIKKALLIGLFQSIAIIPGVSRSAATIIGGIFLGMDRKSAVEYSFMLAIPTMAAATGIDVLQSNLAYSSSEIFMLGVGFVTAFISALIAVKFLLKFVQTNSFVPFGIYRIILSIIFLIFLL